MKSSRLHHVLILFLLSHYSYVHDGSGWGQFRGQKRKEQSQAENGYFAVIKPYCRIHAKQVHLDMINVSKSLNKSA